jgi:hypothetical protein
MAGTSNSERVQQDSGKRLTQHDLESLARFHDDHGHAVSFYFKPGGGSERDDVLINLRVRDIISNHFLCGDKGHGLLRDLDSVMELCDAGIEASGPAKVVFACHEKGVWREFTVPSSARIVRLEAGDHFDLEPLMRLLRAGSTPTHAA